MADNSIDPNFGDLKEELDLIGERASGKKTKEQQYRMERRNHEKTINLLEQVRDQLQAYAEDIEGESDIPMDLEPTKMKISSSGSPEVNDTDFHPIDPFHQMNAVGIAPTIKGENWKDFKTAIHNGIGFLNAQKDRKKSQEKIPKNGKPITFKAHRVHPQKH